MWNLKNQKMNEYNKTDIENKLLVTSGEREGGRDKIVVGD